MNIYLIQDDGEAYCVRAESMQKAISICEGLYLKEIQEDQGDNFNRKEESEYYQEQILQSCQLVGQLKN